MKLESLKLNKQQRNLDVTVSDVNAEDRTVVVVMATEHKVLRTVKRKNGTEFTFWEVIDHSDPEAFNRARIDNGGLSVCLDHDTTKVVGKTQEVWQQDGKTYARLYISKTEETLWTQIKEGVRNKLSLGYDIDKGKKVGVAEDGHPIVRISVTGTEISFVGTPADPNCQTLPESIRASEEIDQEIEIEDLPEQARDLSEATTEIVIETKEVVPEEVKEEAQGQSLEVSDTAKIEVVTSAPQANQEMQVNAIRSIGERYSATAEAEICIEQGKSAEQFLTELTNKRGNKNMEQNTFDAKDIQRFSLGRAVQAAATRDVSKAVYEIGVSRELGAQNDEIILPFESIYGRRDLTAGVAATAGNLIDTTMRTDMFSPLAVDNPATANLGVKVVQGLTGYITWPMQDTKPTAANKSENGSIGFSNSSYSMKSVTPHRVGVATRMSNRLLTMGAMAIESMVSADLRQSLNEKIDQQCMYGTGVGDEVKGLFHHTGITTVGLGTDGALLTYDDLVALETAIETNNYHGSKYLFNSKVRGFLKTLRLDPGSGLRALANDGMLNGYSHVISNVIKSDLAKGAGTNLSPILFGDWSQAALFIFGSGIKLQMNPYSDDLEGMIRLVGSVEIDFAITRQNAISAIVDAKLA